MRTPFHVERLELRLQPPRRGLVLSTPSPRAMGVVRLPLREPMGRTVLESRGRFPPTWTVGFGSANRRGQDRQKLLHPGPTWLAFHVKPARPRRLAPRRQLRGSVIWHRLWQTRVRRSCRMSNKRFISLPSHPLEMTRVASLLTASDLESRNSPHHPKLPRLCFRGSRALATVPFHVKPAILPRWGAWSGGWRSC